jgi:hypothetical protein
MTQKHYIAVAAMLNQQRIDTKGHPGQYHRVREITRELASLMKQDNSRFKTGKFFEAAGFPDLTNTGMGTN